MDARVGRNRDAGVDEKAVSVVVDTGDTLLARYAKNMTEDARNGRLDPVLCRDHEIDLMIDILCRRRKTTRLWWAKQAWEKRAD